MFPDWFALITQIPVARIWTEPTFVTEQMPEEASVIEYVTGIPEFPPVAASWKSVSVINLSEIVGNVIVCIIVGIIEPGQPGAVGVSEQIPGIAKAFKIVKDKTSDRVPKKVKFL